jgi:hypothetical protein
MTISECSRESGIHKQKLQQLCRDEVIEAVDISKGGKRANWRIHRDVWTAFIRPSAEPTPVPSTNERLSQRRRRLDHGVKKYI